MDSASREVRCAGIQGQAARRRPVSLAEAGMGLGVYCTAGVDGAAGAAAAVVCWPLSAK
jgi:hypothetical protein